MCGIAGAVSLSAAPLRRPELIERMAARLAHRGPDGQGWLATADAALSVRRLRVLDPRPAADQPFADATGTTWLACNGEIYNAVSLRDRYPRYRYHSHSDVEPILPLYLDSGPAGIAELDGMFALAIWDACRRRLVLARDRAGEKPLFVARLGEELWFASEVAALLLHPDVSRELDHVALEQYLALGHVLEPRTMFAKVRKIEAGTYTCFTEWNDETTRYWNPGRAVVPEAVAPRQLDRLLQDAVARQLTADVPIGIFTSGGVDSSLLAALAVRATGPERLRTFTVGFPERSYDETPVAARLARTLGLRLVRVLADQRGLTEALRVVTERVAEPLADPAILPTYLLARAAREEVTVVLSGEGADELFGGYPTYLGHRLATGFRTLPARAQHALTWLAAALPASPHKVPLPYLVQRFLSAGAEPDWRKRHVAWFGTGLSEMIPLERWDAEVERLGPPFPSDPVAEAMRLDYRTYLRDGLLVKLDRATMLASLEARAPYLDRELTAFALGLDSRLAVRGRTTKWLLKRVAATWLPYEFLHRRKRGLSVPIARWLNTGLRGEVDRLLDPGRLRRRGLVPPAAVGRLVSEHRAGKVNHARALWALVVFEYWHEQWLGE